jgi:hypothetical protein
VWDVLFEVGSQPLLVQLFTGSYRRRLIAKIFWHILWINPNGDYWTFD